MKIGFIHGDNQEMKNVTQLLKSLGEQGAIDELGIGCIRDYYSNKLFPGTSSLWQHAKYLALLPTLYMKAARRKYNSVNDVKKHIVDLEILLTKNLYYGTPENLRTGITGSDMVVRLNSKNYVKYDPTYIYYGGLQSYGILNTPSLYAAINSYSKRINEMPEIFSQGDDGEMNDSSISQGTYDFCICPQGDYEDFTKPCSLVLTPDEATFLKEQIKRKIDSKSLLYFFLSDEKAQVVKSFPEIKDILPLGELRNDYMDALAFSEFIYCAHIYYNYLFSKKTDDEMLEKFKQQRDKWKTMNIDIEGVLSRINISDTSSIEFCNKLSQSLPNEEELDRLITKREKKVKGNRAKIGVKEYDPKNPIHLFRLEYRWGTVSKIINEIRRTN